MKYQCRASEAGSVEAGRPAAHRFFFANRVDGAFVGQPNRASCQVAQPSGAKSLDSNAKLAMLGSKETLLDAYPAVLVAQVAVWGAKSSHTEPNRTSQGTPDRLATRPADRAGPKIHKPGRAISIWIIGGRFAPLYKYMIKCIQQKQQQLQQQPQQLQPGSVCLIRQPHA